MSRLPMVRRVRLLALLCLGVCSASQAALEIISDTIVPIADTQMIYNGQLYFMATVPGFGSELVKSDGTTAGTSVLLDIEPGTDSSGARPQIIYNNTLYFTAVNSASGHELWKTDGTVAGTTVIETFPGSAGFTGLGNFILYNDLIYFEGFTSATGSEMWRSDGTAAGTVQVSDILAGSSNGGFDDPAVYNGLLYFRATNGSFGAGKGSELWRSNGTTAGTSLFADINTGNDSSAPSQLTSFGGFLYFACNDGVEGGELCRSDGVTAGRFLDIRPGGQFFSSNPEKFIIVNDTLFFDAFLGSTEEMWRVSSANIPARVQAGLGLSPADQIEFNGELMYQSNGALYRSDGSEDGGVQISAENGSIGNARTLAASNGRVYFAGVYFQGNSTGFELMRTDGSNAGTTLMVDLAAGPANSFPSNLFDYNNALYFNATVDSVNRWYRFVEEPGSIEFELPSVSVAEDGGSIEITVQRNNGSHGFARVDVSTSPGSASADSDYTSTTQRLTWQPGVATAQTVSIPILDDLLSEGDETFTLSFSDLVGATAGAQTTLTVTISDDDVPLVATADSYTLDEDGNLIANDPDGMLTAGDSSDDGVLANDTGPGSLSVTTTGTLIATGLGGSIDLATDGTFTYTPPAHAFGEDSVEYSMTDGGGTQTATITITVNPINDAPSVIPGPSVSFGNGSSGLQSIPDWVEEFDPGPLESDQSVLAYNVVQITDDDAVLNSVQILDNGELQLDLTGSSGAAQVEFNVQDDGGTANPGDQDTSTSESFQISVDQAVEVALDVRQCNEITGPGFAHDYGIRLMNHGPDTTSEIQVVAALVGEISQIIPNSLPPGTVCDQVDDNVLCTIVAPIAPGIERGLNLRVFTQTDATSDLGIDVQITTLALDTNTSNNDQVVSTELIEDLVYGGNFESCTVE